MNKPRAALFDLDGTLIDTTELIIHSFNHAWSTVCQMTHSRQSLVATMGIPLRDAMRQLLTALDGCGAGQPDLKIEETVEDLLREYRHCNRENHDRMVRPFPGVSEAIQQLSSQGFRIGLVTSKSREFALRGLSLCRIDQFFEVLVCVEDTELHKPHPAPLHLALQRLGTPFQHATYVGDSRHDIQAGRAARMKTTAVLWGPVPKMDLELEQPDFMAEQPGDLVTILGQI